jgi:hypothetical protein
MYVDPSQAAAHQAPALDERKYFFMIRNGH